MRGRPFPRWGDKARAALRSLGGCGKQPGLLQHIFGDVLTRENLRHLKRRDGVTLPVLKGNPGLDGEK